MSISWDGTKGSPIGTVKYISKYGLPYTGEEESGHFFPIKFKDKYLNQLVNVGGQNGVGGKNFTPNADDPYLVIRVENVTVNNKITAIVKETQEEIFELDFNETTLALPLGKDAVAIPSQEKSFGKYGNTVDLIDENLSVAWDGINGTVTGDVKSYTYDNDVFSGDEKTGHYLPIVLAPYKGQKVTCITEKQKTAKEYEWIIRIDNVMSKSKKITFKVSGTTVAVLDLSGVQLK